MCKEHYYQLWNHGDPCTICEWSTKKPMSNWTEIEKEFDEKFADYFLQMNDWARKMIPLMIKSFFKTHLEAAYQEGKKDAMKDPILLSEREANVYLSREEAYTQGRREALQEAIEVIPIESEKDVPVDNRDDFSWGWNARRDAILKALTALSSTESKEI